MTRFFEEEWRPIPNFPRYEVSCFGRVRNIEAGGRILKPNPCRVRDGAYLKVWLYRRTIRYPRWVHRLVAETFHPNPDRKPEVNHFDGNPLNNEAANLEWATRREQEAHKRFMQV